MEKSLTTRRQVTPTQQTGKPKSQTALVVGLLSGHESARVKGGDGSNGNRKGYVRSRWQKQPWNQVRRPSNAATVSESVAQGSDCTVTAGAAATRTDTLWAHNPLSLETEGTPIITKHVGMQAQMRAYMPPPPYTHSHVHTSAHTHACKHARMCSNTYTHNNHK